jgi:mono/diheme cytochrome c family protein
VVRTVGRNTTFIDTVRPRPTALIDADGVLIGRYATDQQAVHVFRLVPGTFPELERDRVLILTALSPQPSPTALGQLDRCAFGTGVKPLVAPMYSSGNPPSILNCVSASAKSEDAGKVVLGQTGCLACHRLGGAGNNGPGGELTSIGRELSQAQIRQAVINPTAPMPSYRSLPAKQLNARISYLASSAAELQSSWPLATGRASVRAEWGALSVTESQLCSSAEAGCCVPLAGRRGVRSCRPRQRCFYSRTDVSPASLC